MFYFVFLRLQQITFLGKNCQGQDHGHFLKALDISVNLHPEKLFQLTSHFYYVPLNI